MGHATESGDLPVLTKEGVRALVQQLAADLQSVQASANVELAVKEDIAERLSELTGVLTIFLGSDMTNASDWVFALKDGFAALTPDLANALNAPFGSCVYAGNDGPLCIRTTLGQCTALNGIFTLGGTCP